VPNEILGGGARESSFPVAKIHSKGKRPTRSAGRTPLRLSLAAALLACLLSILHGIPRCPLPADY
jgi:hypothetical protein